MYEIYSFNNTPTPYRKSLKIHGVAAFSRRTPMSISGTVALVTTVSLFFIGVNSFSADYGLIVWPGTIGDTEPISAYLRFRVEAQGHRRAARRPHWPNAERYGRRLRFRRRADSLDWGIGLRAHGYPADGAQYRGRETEAERTHTNGERRNPTRRGKRKGRRAEEFGAGSGAIEAAHAGGAETTKATVEVDDSNRAIQGFPVSSANTP